MSRLLLISSSTVFGTGYLDHAQAQILRILAGRARLLFVPYALADWKGYAARVQKRLESMGVSVQSAHETPDPKKAVAGAQAIFIGGGNTFRLLKALQDLDLIGPIQARVAQDAVYIGSSAGTNVACPTIRTTNDMPICEASSLDALGLVPFQINCHYLDADPSSRHMGETREERILQFHEENAAPVLALREGAMLRVEDGVAELAGIAGGRLFRKGLPPAEVAVGSRLESLWTIQ